MDGGVNGFRGVLGDELVDLVRQLIPDGFLGRGIHEHREDLVLGDHVHDIAHEAVHDGIADLRLVNFFTYGDCQFILQHQRVCADGF